MIKVIAVKCVSIVIKLVFLFTRTAKAITLFLRWFREIDDFVFIINEIQLACIHDVSIKGRFTSSSGTRELQLGQN